MSDKKRTHTRTRTFAVSLVAFAIAIASASVGPLHAAGAVQQPAASQKPSLDIMLTTKPSPPKTGENTFEVMVKGTAGKPVSNADVSIVFVMPKTASMAEMRTDVKLASSGTGMYVGSGQVMMAGMWRVTLSVKQDGKHCTIRNLQQCFWLCCC